MATNQPAKGLCCLSLQLQEIRQTLTENAEFENENRKLLHKISQCNQQRFEILYGLFAVLFGIVYCEKYLKEPQYELVSYACIAFGFVYALSRLFNNFHMDELNTVTRLRKRCSLTNTCHCTSTVMEVKQFESMSAGVTNLKNKVIELEQESDVQIEETKEEIKGEPIFRRQTNKKSKSDDGGLLDEDGSPGSSKFKMARRFSDYDEDDNDNETKEELSPRLIPYEDSEPTGIDGWVIKSKNEAEAVRELRDNLEDIESECKYIGFDTSDSTLIRFLRARKLDITLAEEMFRDALAFRKDVKTEQYAPHLYTPCRLFRELFPGGLCGEDREGSPVFYDRIGNIDIIGLLKKVPDHEEYVKFGLNRNEKNMQRLYDLSKGGQEQYQILIIEDLSGLCYSKHVSDV